MPIFRQVTSRQISLPIITAIASIKAVFFKTMCLQAACIITAGFSLSVAASSLEPNLTITGHLQQGGLVIGQVSEGASVQYQEKLLPITAGGQFVIGLDRDAPERFLLALIVDGKQQQHEFIVIPRDYAIQRIEGVAKQYVSPDPVQVKRSRKEAALVRAARKLQRDQQDFLNGFIWPAKGPITGVFGSQRVYNGEPRRPHYGLDVAGPVGTPVIAPAAGLVTLAEPDLFISGGTLIIDHGHGLSSTFLHLSKLLVKSGDNVEQGDAIAEIGATGRVTGPHLDWRMNWTNGDTSVRIDPELLVAKGGNELTGD